MEDKGWIVVPNRNLLEALVVTAPGADDDVLPHLGYGGGQTPLLDAADGPWFIPGAHPRLLDEILLLFRGEGRTLHIVLTLGRGRRTPTPDAVSRVLRVLAIV